MLNILDSYVAKKTAASTIAYTPIKSDIDLSKYSLAIAYFDTDEKNSYVSRVFETFIGCHETASGETTDDPGVVITAIKDENGAFLNSKINDDPVPYGVYVRNNLPMWVLQIIGNLVSVLCFTFEENGDKVTIPIESAEHFDTWFGEDPHEFAFVDDIVFTSFEKSEIAEKLRILSPSWELPRVVLVPLKIVGINKEKIQLSPVADLSRVIPFAYDVDIKMFRNCLFEKTAHLFSVTISSK